MSKFKVGQRVKCLGGCGGGKVAEVGKTYTVTGVNAKINGAGPKWRLVLDNEIYTDGVHCFEPATPTLDSLSVGDVVVSSYNSEVTVLAVLPGLVGLSLAGKPDYFLTWRTIAQLKSDGYTVKGEDEEDEVKELTMDEVAKLAGVAVDKLRIRKEAE